MTNTISAASRTETYDAGLRSFMTGVYNRMFIAVAITGILAFLSSVEPLFSLFYHINSKGKLSYTLLGIVVAFAPLAVILMRGFFERLGNWVALWTIAALFGLGLGSIFIVYTGASIATTFFATAVSFGALSLWGYTTKRDLSGWGVFLLAALIGIIVVSLLNIFLLHSSVGQLIISGIALIVFAGFIAYDTQNVKLRYDPDAGPQSQVRAQADGALNLYLDFINFFLNLLPFLGNRK